MNWLSKTRETLKVSAVDIGKSKKNTNSESIRRTILKKYNETCRFCGGQFKKFLICIHIDNDKSNSNISNLDMACRFCYSITHLNTCSNKGMVIGYSKMDQKEIVRKTTNSLIKHNTIKSMTQIDSDAKLIQLSIMELSNILVSIKSNIDKNIKIPMELSNYKIFFTEDFDTNFLNFSTAPMFIDEDSVEIDNPVVEPEIYEFSKDELKFLESVF